jgi:hypothetical protein
MAKKIKKLKMIVPGIKKEINDFLLNEEGKISKKSIAKIGITLAVLGMALTPQDGSAQTVTVHSNSATSHSSSYMGTAGHNSYENHTNGFTTSHTAHSSHCNCDWM